VRRRQRSKTLSIPPARAAPERLLRRDHCSVFLGERDHCCAIATWPERQASPTAAIIDCQSVKNGEKEGRIDPHGFDAGKLIKGKKRHLLV
jgi:hypothetical protein